MKARKQKYYYAVVEIKNERLILESGNLPIFWMEKVAKEYLWAGTKIIRISHDKLQQLLSDSSAPIRTDEADKESA